MCPSKIQLQFSTFRVNKLKDIVLKNIYVRLKSVNVIHHRNNNTAGQPLLSMQFSGDIRGTYI